MKLRLTLALLCCAALATAQTVDSALVKQLDSLVLESRALTGKKDFAAAQKLNDAAERTALEKLGPASPTYGNCLFNHGRIVQLSGDAAAALPFYLDAKKVQEAAPGADPRHLASTLNNIGIIYKQQRKFALAEPIYLKTREIREQIFTKKHPQYADILNNLGTLYFELSRFADAQKQLEEARALWEKDLKMDESKYADVLDNLGSTYARLGRFADAEGLFLKAKEIKARLFGADSREHAQLLNDLANLYRDQSRYEEAERFYEQSKKALTAPGKKPGTDLAQVLTNLGRLYLFTGRYEEAEATLLESAGLWKALKGAESTEHARALDAVGFLYRRLGELGEAKLRYQRALDIQKKSDPNSSDIGVELTNLANLHFLEGRFEAAKPLYTEAMSVFEKTAGRADPKFAWAVHNLGLVEGKLGNAAAAETRLNEARAIRERVLGKDHPDLADNLEDLALLFQKTSRPADALKLNTEARAIFEKAYGKQHPRYEESTRNLAMLHLRQGRPAEAAPLLAEANGLRRSFLEKSTRYLSERELGAYAATFAGEIDALCSFSRQFPLESAGMAATLFDNELFYKGFLLTASNQVRRLAGRDTASQKKQELLIAANRRLAALLAKPAAEREGVKTAEDEVNFLEKDLVRSVAGYDEAAKQVSWKDVQAKLQPGEAAVEFVHYRFSKPEGPTDSTFYAALVVKPGDAQPAFVQLFEEKSLDSLFAGFTTRAGDYANTIYSFPKRGAKQVGRPRRSLYELIWKNLDGPLAGAKTVYFSPSGLLHRLNLGAIPYSLAESVGDRVKLVQLGSGRQVVAPFDKKFDGSSACLMGDIVYDIDSTALPTAESLASRGRGQKTENISPKRGNDSPELAAPWQTLDWTAMEVESIAGLYEAAGVKATELSGSAANEEAFKFLGENERSPRHLHMATHGYFFADPTAPGSGGRAGDGGEDQVFRSSQNPMIRSGLILAGGNFAWTTNRTAVEGMEDGILTAFEISQMDLTGTELVVLSACETGLGDIRGNEGVYGLQRAFKIAGARYLVMSLWQVPDQETSVFMTAFYKKMLAEKLPIPDAFRAAQKEMKDRFINPYQWAGFVLVE